MPGTYAHSGSQNPSGSPKRRRWDRSPASTWTSRAEFVATSGSTAWVALEVMSETRPSSWRLLKRAERPAQLAKPREPAPVAVGLVHAGRPEGSVLLLGIDQAGAEPELLAERIEPLHQSRRFELIGENGRDRHRQAVGHLEHGKVGAEHGVEQPLLAERIRAEPLDIGHVGVKDEREHSLRLFPPRERSRPEHG